MQAETRKRILFIHQDGLITGSAISLKYLLLGLDQSKFELKIILAGDGPYKLELEKLGFNVEVVKLRGFWTAPGPSWYRKGAFLNLKALFPKDDIVRTARAFNPHLIHINDKAMLVAGLKLKKLGIPIVQHLRSTYFPTRTPLFAWISQKAIESYATYLIGISEDELHEFKNFSPQAVVHNSLDVSGIEGEVNKRDAIREEFAIRENEKLITYIGFFAKVKGSWDFISMVSHYIKKYPANTTKFMMVGKLPKESQRKGLSKILDWGSNYNAHQELKEQLKKYKLEDRIIFTDYRSDVFALIAASDVLVMCNRAGAMGRQAFESMAIGTPLVITEGQSGKSSVVVNNVTAKVVKAKDPVVLAKAAYEMLTQPEETLKLVANAKAYVRDHFDYRGNAKKIEAVYHQLIKK